MKLAPYGPQNGRVTPLLAALGGNSLLIHGGPSAHVHILYRRIPHVGPFAEVQPSSRFDKPRRCYRDIPDPRPSQYRLQTLFLPLVLCPLLIGSLDVLLVVRGHRLHCLGIPDRLEILHRRGPPICHNLCKPRPLLPTCVRADTGDLFLPD